MTTMQLQCTYKTAILGGRGTGRQFFHLLEGYRKDEILLERPFPLYKDGKIG